MLEDNEQSFLDYYMDEKKSGNAEFKICHEKAKYCNERGDGTYGSDEATIRHDYQ